MHDLKFKLIFLVYVSTKLEVSLSNGPQDPQKPKKMFFKFQLYKYCSKFKQLSLLMISSDTKVGVKKIKLLVDLLLTLLNFTHYFISPKVLYRHLIHPSTASASHSRPRGLQ